MDSAGNTKQFVISSKSTTPSSHLLLTPLHKCFCAGGWGHEVMLGVVGPGGTQPPARAAHPPSLLPLPFHGQEALIVFRSQASPFISKYLPSAPEDILLPYWIADIYPP